MVLRNGAVDRLRRCRMKVTLQGEELRRFAQNLSDENRELRSALKAAIGRENRLAEQTSTLITAARAVIDSIDDENELDSDAVTRLAALINVD